eukprot:scpid39117/ scgid20524/ 
MNTSKTAEGATCEYTVLSSATHSVAPCYYTLPRIPTHRYTLLHSVTPCYTALALPTPLRTQEYSAALGMRSKLTGQHINTSSTWHRFQRERAFSCLCAVHVQCV